MGELNYPETDHEWAIKKGIIKKCPNHGTIFDPMVGCKQCLEEAKKKRKSKGVFDNVIWPDNLSNGGSNGQ